MIKWINEDLLQLDSFRIRCFSINSKLFFCMAYFCRMKEGSLSLTCHNVSRDLPFLYLFPSTGYHWKEVRMMTWLTIIFLFFKYLYEYSNVPNRRPYTLFFSTIFSPSVLLIWVYMLNGFSKKLIFCILLRDIFFTKWSKKPVNNNFWPVWLIYPEKKIPACMFIPSCMLTWNSRLLRTLELESLARLARRVILKIETLKPNMYLTTSVCILQGEMSLKYLTYIPTYYVLFYINTYNKLWTSSVTMLLFFRKIITHTFYILAWPSWEWRGNLSSQWKCKYHSLCWAGYDINRANHHICWIGWQGFPYIGTQIDWT